MKRDISIILVCLSFVLIAGCSWVDLLDLTPIGWMPEAIIAEIALDAMLSGDEDAVEWIGMEVRSSDKSLSRQYGIDPKEKGVVIVKVEPQGAAEQFGLMEGDLIKKINQLETNDIEEFYETAQIIKDQHVKELDFTIIRLGELQQIMYPPKKEGEEK